MSLSEEFTLILSEECKRSLREEGVFSVSEECIVSLREEHVLGVTEECISSLSEECNRALVRNVYRVSVHVRNVY